MENETVGYAVELEVRVPKELAEKALPLLEKAIEALVGFLELAGFVVPVSGVASEE